MVKNWYPLPRIDELFDQMKGVRVLSNIDLTLGYHQIWMHEVDIHQIGFHYGCYEFMAVPFGLTNMPLVFMSLMNGVFHIYLNWCVILFLDDLLIYSKTIEEHEVPLC